MADMLSKAWIILKGLHHFNAEDADLRLHGF
jgi:hypothetical protein